MTKNNVDQCCFALFWSVLVSDRTHVPLPQAPRFGTVNNSVSFGDNNRESQAFLIGKFITSDMGKWPFCYLKYLSDSCAAPKQQSVGGREFQDAMNRQTHVALVKWWMNCFSTKRVLARRYIYIYIGCQSSPLPSIFDMAKTEARKKHAQSLPDMKVGGITKHHRYTSLLRAFFL